MFITARSRICWFVFAATGLLAQTSQPALTPGIFTARGLVNEEVLKAIFIGDFGKIAFDREDEKFSNLFANYLLAYGKHCDHDDALPKNKVPIMESVCDRWEYPVNNFGVRTGGDRCAHFHPVPTGYFAKPELYDLEKSLDRQKVADFGRMASVMMGQVSGPNPLSGLANTVAVAQAAASDMDAMVQMNECKGPGLMRFEANLHLFARNRPPIRLDGKTTVTSVTAPVPGVPFKDQNYTKLLADLVADDATKWGMAARLVPGSVTGASVTSRDEAGRPSKIVAPYAWNGLLRAARSSVTLTFADGLPECLYYAETPAVCHTPNRQMVAAYADGAYR